MKTIMNRQKQKNKHAQALSKVRQIIAEIVFGMPSKDCKNYGICRVISNSVIPRSANVCKDGTCINYTATSILTLLDNEKIELHCLRSTLSPETINKHFNNKYFLVQEDYHLSTDICQELDVDQLSIKKGKYKIKRTKSLIKIKFY